MNPLEDQLDRLLRAAAAAPSRLDAATAPPFGLETRVLAAWRGAAAEGIWNTALLVRGLGFAGIITALCLWPALTQNAPAGPDTEYLQLADSTLQVDSL